MFLLLTWGSSAIIQDHVQRVRPAQGVRIRLYSSGMRQYYEDFDFSFASSLPSSAIFFALLALSFKTFNTSWYVSSASFRASWLFSCVSEASA